MKTISRNVSHVHYIGNILVKNVKRFSQRKYVCCRSSNVVYRVHLQQEYCGHEKQKKTIVVDFKILYCSENVVVCFDVTADLVINTTVEKPLCILIFFF